MVCRNTEYRPRWPIDRYAASSCCRGDFRRSFCHCPMALPLTFRPKRAFAGWTLAVSASLPSVRCGNFRKPDYGQHFWSNIDGGIGGASAAAAADTGASNTNGFLRWLQGQVQSLHRAAKPRQAACLSPASDGYFIVGGATADGSTPAARTYSVRVGGQGLQRQQTHARSPTRESGGELPTYSPALTITEKLERRSYVELPKVAELRQRRQKCSHVCRLQRHSPMTSSSGRWLRLALLHLRQLEWLSSRVTISPSIPIGDIYARSASCKTRSYGARDMTRNPPSLMPIVAPGYVDKPER